MGSDLSARIGAALTRQGAWPDAFGMVCRCGEWVGTLWAVEMRGDEWSARLRGCGNQSFPVADLRPDLSAWPTVGVLLGLLADIPGACPALEYDSGADEWSVRLLAADDDSPTGAARSRRIGDAVTLCLLAAWGEP